MITKILKIKWWDNFNFQHATITKVKEWFSKNEYLQEIDIKINAKFLNDKSKLLAALAQTTSEADFQKILALTASSSSLSTSPPPSVEDEAEEELDYDLNDPYLDSQPI